MKGICRRAGASLSMVFRKNQPWCNQGYQFRRGWPNPAGAMLLAALLLVAAACQSAPVPPENTDQAVAVSPAKNQPVSPDGNVPATPPSSPAGPASGRETDSTSVNYAPPPEPAASAEARRLNDLALVLAGLPVEADSPSFPLTRSKSWSDYRLRAGTVWNRFENRTMSKIRAWSDTELTSLPGKEDTVFYPFSGPDFLYLQAFLPRAETSVLIGLEPVGQVPELSGMEEKKLARYWKLLDYAIEDALAVSFFKTDEMARELNNSRLKGTLPVLMLFLARTGNQIRQIRHMIVTSNGTLLPVSSPRPRKKTGKYGTAVEILYHSPGAGRVQRLLYLCADLSDGGLAAHPEIQACLNNLPAPFITFSKSASYLMHKFYFSSIRTFILEKSLAVVQDDSAIPFRFFEEPDWQVRLYGSYARPIKKFKKHTEPDLRQAYQADGKELGFRFGYARRSNLLVARKVRG